MTFASNSTPSAPASKLSSPSKVGLWPHRRHRSQHYPTCTCALKTSKLAAGQQAVTLLHAQFGQASEQVGAVSRRDSAAPGYAWCCQAPLPRGREPAPPRWPGARPVRPSGGWFGVWALLPHF
jgi:hypothetical protein